MNRDEQLARPTARPPAIQKLGAQQALFPSEPGGGAWIGVNQAAVGCALVNWYAIPDQVRRKPFSRGLVVRAALTASTVKELESILRALPLDRVNPFRFIAAFAATGRLWEWRWNRRQLTRHAHPWEPAVWISSGCDEPGAQAARRRVFDQARRQRSAGRLDWLRRLHRSHQPAPGPYSVCMHRPDAATVSYTEIQVGPATLRLRYQPGCPCARGPFSSHDLKRTLTPGHPSQPSPRSLRAG